MLRVGLSVLCTAAAACLALMPSNSSQAVSFDCSKASNLVETYVCAKPDLSELDDRLAVVYSNARQQARDSSQLLSDQRAWLLRRNLCKTADCISREYETRLAALSNQQENQLRELSVSAGNRMEVQLLSKDGTLSVPVLINNSITLDFIVDSGAADVSVPADVVMTLRRTGTITDDDFLGKRTYRLADGSTVPSETFRIRSLKVGSRVLENVTASVASGAGELLLGQSFLARFQSWSINNQRRVLILE